MAYEFFSLNGEILPVELAKIELSNIEYAYGFGVYENVRVSKGRIFFLKEHIQRLLSSAEIIGIEHGFSSSLVENSVEKLLEKLKPETCNVKILLIGGKDKGSANLYIMCLNPLFPDRKLYKTGAYCITENYERPFPHAKSLNMLPSYLAYKKAKQVGAYDALLVNRENKVAEGTRTNFFAIKDKTIYSPPESEILLGVTRDKVIKVAKQNSYQVVEKDLPLSELPKYDGTFITSTGSKIMPIKTIDNLDFEIPDELYKLIGLFNKFLDDYAKKK
ncbi:aminotransferase class IV [Candidatus Parcubacteria bacterium]|nr:aminotransferase class IV [Candidatus Parcubacteria bacterium]